MRNAARTMLALAIATTGAMPVIIGAGMLLSGPDRDGVGGLDWAPLALPMIAFGALIMTFAWLVFRDRPTATSGMTPRRQQVLAVLLAGLGLAGLGLAINVFAHASGATDTAPAAIRIFAGIVAVPGLLLVAIAWRYRRAPHR